MATKKKSAKKKPAKRKATKKKATKKKATKKKATKKKATKKKPAKKKPAKRKATKRKATKRKATKKKPATRGAKKKGRRAAAAGAPAWLKELKRGDRFRELSNKQLAIFCGYEADKSGARGSYVVRMKDTGKNPLTYKLTTATLQKFFKQIASRKPVGKSNGKSSAADKKQGSGGASSRERAIRSWLK